MEEGKPQTAHYFIDEGGDSTLFSRRGKVMVESDGCSRFFMLGLLEVPDPSALQCSLKGLRRQLLSDPYFCSIPTMQREKRKTALAFHAKDDHPEVRREVFELLSSMDELRFLAVVADKNEVVKYVRRRNEEGFGYHYLANSLYDFLAQRLLKQKLHKFDTYNIFFSKRGKSDRTSALRSALETSRDQYTQRHGISNSSILQVFETTPKQQAGLQAVDYFTWALQRLYERQEEEYVKCLGESIRLVLDIDDKRKAGYGKFYTRKKPISAASLAWRHEKKPGI